MSKIKIDMIQILSNLDDIERTGGRERLEHYGAGRCLDKIREIASKYAEIKFEPAQEGTSKTQPFRVTQWLRRLPALPFLSTNNFRVAVVALLMLAVLAWIYDMGIRSGQMGALQTSYEVCRKVAPYKDGEGCK